MKLNNEPKKLWLNGKNEKPDSSLANKVLIAENLVVAINIFVLFLSGPQIRYIMTLLLTWLTGTLSVCGRSMSHISAFSWSKVGEYTWLQSGHPTSHLTCACTIIDSSSNTATILVTHHFWFCVLYLYQTVSQSLMNYWSLCRVHVQRILSTVPGWAMWVVIYTILWVE